MKKKILYLTFHPEIGGGETILLSLISKLDKKKFEPIVVVTKKGQLSKRLRELKIKTYILPLPGYLIRTLFIPGASPVGIYHFYKLCKKIKPDLIHINHLNLAIYAGISSKILKIPTVATSHGSWDSIYFYQDIISNYFCHSIITPTKPLKNKLLKRNLIRNDKITVIPFGVDEKIFKPADKEKAKKKLKIDSKKYIISTVGRIDPIKDHLSFLKAAKIVIKKYPETIFLVAGSALGNFSNNNKYEENIKNFLKINPFLKKRVVFTGFLNDIEKIYQASDIYVCSSHSESFGLSLVEASMCSVPIVSTNNGNQSSIVKNNRTGFLVKPSAPLELAQKIMTLAANPSLRKSFGKNAESYTLKKFSLAGYVNSVEQNYSRLTK